ncbi:MAG: sulfotransferase domain-containing protein [Paracoccaceae bacterium]|nr:sulfotransferase domain-containing protein [Paracoccaceae bacterium]
MAAGSGNLIWIASYPKSGNTWMRMFLANYMAPRSDGQPFRLTDLGATSSSDARVRDISRAVGQDCHEMAPEELYRGRQRHLEILSASEKPTLLKTHMPNAILFGMSLIPAELSRCAIYIVRNPLDIVPSYAHYMELDIERSVELLASSKNWTRGNERQITQMVGDWSMHVRSWLSVDDFPVLVVRYEDLIDDPAKHFANVVETIGMPLDDAKLNHAIEASRFDELQAQDKQVGYSGRDVPFFRKGIKGDWKDTLPEDLSKKVISDHGKVMAFLRYLDGSS